MKWSEGILKLICLSHHIKSMAYYFTFSYTSTRSSDSININSKHYRLCSTTFLNTKKIFENLRRTRVFLTNFKVFGNVAGYTQSWVFDINTCVSSQLKLNFRSQWRNRIMMISRNYSSTITVMIFFVLTWWIEKCYIKHIKRLIYHIPNWSCIYDTCTMCF